MDKTGGILSSPHLLYTTLAPIWSLHYIAIEKEKLLLFFLGDTYHQNTRGSHDWGYQCCRRLLSV